MEPAIKLINTNKDLQKDCNIIKTSFFIMQEMVRLQGLINTLEADIWEDIYEESLKEPIDPKLLEEVNTKATKDLEVFYSQINFRRETLKNKLAEDKL